MLLMTEAMILPVCATALEEHEAAGVGRQRKKWRGGCSLALSPFM